MRIEHLRCFIAAAEEGSFTKAAHQMSFTQSAVSRIIDSLERDLGFLLFFRLPRKVQLTPLGETLYPYVKEALAQLDKGINLTKSNEGGQEPLRVGHFNLAADRHFNDLLKRFELLNSAAHANYVEDDPFVLIDLVADMSLDVSVVVMSAAIDKRLPPEVECWIIGETYEGFVVAKDDPLIKRPSLNVEDLTDSTIITPHYGLTKQSILLQRISGQADITVINAIAISSCYSMVSQRRGIGLCLVAENQWAMADSVGVGVVPYADADPYSICLIWNRYNSSTLLADFLSYANSAIQAGDYISIEGNVKP
jgi:DNA-binding transcriptional LysR family regulator